MALDRFVIALRAQAKYEEELGKKLGINPYSEYGRKKLNEYLDQQRRDDQLRARWHLESENSGGFISESQIIDETLRIRKERLKPYTEEAKEIYKKQQQEEKQEQGVSNSTAISSESGSLLAQITYEQENQEIDSAISTLNLIYQEQETQEQETPHVKKLIPTIKKFIFPRR